MCGCVGIYAHLDGLLPILIGEEPVRKTWYTQNLPFCQQRPEGPYQIRRLL